MQKLLDPLGGAHTDDDGVVNYHVEDKEITGVDNDDLLKAEYEKSKASQEVWDIDEEDEDAFRLAMLQELEEGNAYFSIEEFHKVLDKEFAVFKEGEKYDYVKDLKEAYKSSLKQTKEDRIFDTIPDHVFWDIKKPQNSKKTILPKNRYNPFRGKEFDSFFQMRDFEEYMDRQAKKENKNDAVSLFRRF